MGWRVLRPQRAIVVRQDEWDIGRESGVPEEIMQSGWSAQMRSSAARRGAKPDPGTE